MKKILALTLALVMALSLAACGGGTTSASTPASTPAPGSGDAENASMIFAWWGNQTRNERTQGAIDAYTAAHSGVSIDGQFSEWADYWTKLATASAGHNLPDIVQMDYKYLTQYVSNGLLVDMQPYIDSGALDTSAIDDGIMTSGSVDGGVYAICLGVNAPALIYNKTLTDELDITVKDNMSMDEFYAICREVYEKSGVKTNIAYNNGENYLEYVIRDQGHDLYSDTAFAFDSYEEFLPFFEMYEMGLEEGWHVTPDVFAERTIGSVEQEPLVYGSSPDTRSWCYFGYSNQLAASQTAADAEDITLGITTWPANNAAQANYLKPSQFISVSTDAANPDAAVAFVNYITNDVDCNNILLGERGVPASSVVADAIAPNIDETAQTVTAYINTVVTPNCSAISPAAPSTSSEVLTLINACEEELMYGQITAEEAAQKLFNEGNAILAG